MGMGRDPNWIQETGIVFSEKSLCLKLLESQASM